MKYCIKAAAFANGFSLILICLYLSVALPGFSPAYYMWAYDRHNIPQAVDMELNELMAVTNHMIGYMKGKEPDLAIDAVVAGGIRPFFNQREIDHMIDVKNLFQASRVIVTASAATFALTGGFLLLKRRSSLKPTKTLAYVYKWLPLCFTALLGAAAGLAVLDFNRAFTAFHLIFFSNDLWILDPRTDLLINIVPEPFFMDISVVIAVIFLLCMVLMTIYGALVLRKTREP